MWFVCSVSGGVNIRKEEKRKGLGTCACEWMLGFHAGMYCLWWKLHRSTRINGAFFLLNCTCGISDLEVHPYFWIWGVSLLLIIIDVIIVHQLLFRGYPAIGQAWRCVPFYNCTWKGKGVIFSKEELKMSMIQDETNGGKYFRQVASFCKKTPYSSTGWPAHGKELNLSVSS